MKDPDKVLLPSSNLVLIALREDESGGCISFTLLDDLRLYLGHSSAIETLESRLPGVRITRSGSHSQISNRIENGLVETI